MALIRREPTLNLPLTMQPVPYSSEIPVPKPTEKLEDIPEDSEDEASSLACQIYDSKMKRQKKKEKDTSYSHLSQEQHPFCTRRWNSIRLSGGFQNQQKILMSIVARLCAEEVPCSNGPRVCGMASAFW
ncbi:hypothetical protein AVEN_263730-1 [Araneus ventricosus]|uniref:Uncharacterized protein n=1 Tax=Araneus ventricosus TaxID=182803 RepID=A0A4Y2AT30_ARAVE|nr:hypothetical protein AVEN_263730-1 [Araneus ventricosus]